MLKYSKYMKILKNFIAKITHIILFLNNFFLYMYVYIRYVCTYLYFNNVNSIIVVLIAI